MEQNTSPAGQAPQPNSGLGAIWVAYALHAVGAIGFVFGPLIGLIVNYIRADDAGIAGTHHRWLIRTFWWTFAGCALFLVLIICGLWPLVGDVLRDAVRHGGSVEIPSINITWDSIFATIGATIVGGIGMFCVWIWFLYRIIRGALRLGDEQPAT